MSNIAEGFESKTRAMFMNYLGLAKASAGEVRSQLYIALDLGYISDEKFGLVSDKAKKASSQIYRFTEYLKS
jgi:four helix bundle protein